MYHDGALCLFMTFWNGSLSMCLSLDIPSLDTLAQILRFKLKISTTQSAPGFTTAPRGFSTMGSPPSPFTPSPSPFTNPSQFKLQCLDLNLALQCHAALHRSKNWFRSSMSTRWTGLEILWRWDVSFAFWFFLETSTKVESRKCKTSVKLQSFVV